MFKLHSSGLISLCGNVLNSLQKILVFPHGLTSNRYQFTSYLKVPDTLRDFSENTRVWLQTIAMIAVEFRNKIMDFCLLPEI